MFVVLLPGGLRAEPALVPLEAVGIGLERWITAQFSKWQTSEQRYSLALVMEKTQSYVFSKQPRAYPESQKSMTFPVVEVTLPVIVLLKPDPAWDSTSHQGYKLPRAQSQKDFP